MVDQRERYLEHLLHLTKALLLQNELTPAKSGIFFLHLFSTERVCQLCGANKKSAILALLELSFPTCLFSYQLKHK
jgi:hypothetical protein